MIRTSAYGRLGQDPQAITTKTGKPMARASIAVDVTPYNVETPDTEWFSIIAFGHAAEDLLRCQKGGLLAVSGALVRTRWTGKDGQAKASWQITAEDLHAANTVRPTGGRRGGEPGAAHPEQFRPTPPRQETAPPHDDGDDMPW